MKTQLSTLALLAGLAAAGAAFAQPVGGPEAKGNAPLKAPHEVNNGSASHGANSFTEGQARDHITRAGFSGVSGLSKGDDGVWRGSAMKNGASMPVAMDYKGNVTTGSPAGGAVRHARSATTTTRTVTHPAPVNTAPAMSDQAAPAEVASTTTTAAVGAGMMMHHHRHHRHMHHLHGYMHHHHHGYMHRRHRHHMMRGTMPGGIPGERMDGQGAAMSGVDRDHNGISDKEDRATGR